MSNEEILTVVCQQMGISEQEIKSTSRKTRNVVARFILFDLLTKEGNTHQEVADLVGKERTAVTYGLTALRNWLSFDKKLKSKYEKIKAAIHEQA